MAHSRFEEVKDEIIALVENGCTESAAFGSKGIAERTYYDWKKRHAQFAQDILKAREASHAIMIGRLIRAAMDGKVGAIIFWLKNRHPEAWRDVHQITGKDGGPIRLQAEQAKLKEILTDPELRDAAITISQRLTDGIDTGGNGES